MQRGTIVTKLLSGFYRVMSFLAAVAMATTFFCVMLSIISRQLGFNIRGLDAYSGYAIGAALFLALPETLRRGDHIRVTLALEKVPAAVRGVLEYWCLLAGVGLSAYLAWFACRLVWTSRIYNDISQSLDATPLWIPQLAMALGCVGLAIAFIDALFARLQGRDFFVAAGADTANIE
jgi:TRAP-type C4-dicarboxylate transport system permease small subunit